MKKMNSKILAYAGVLVAINVILTRFVSIPIGTSLRISAGATPMYLAGFWFGPVIGGICGATSDILGCILQGYAPNPFIFITSVLAGVIPGLMRNFISKKPDLWRVIVVVGIHGLIGGLGFTTVGLHIYYGQPWSVLYATRSIQTLLLTAFNSMLVFFLYRSVLTKFLTEQVYRVTKKPQRAGK